MPSELRSPPSPLPDTALLFCWGASAPPTPPSQTGHFSHSAKFRNRTRPSAARPPGAPSPLPKEGEQGGIGGGPPVPPAPLPSQAPTGLSPTQSVPASTSWARLLGQGPDGRTDGRTASPARHSLRPPHRGAPRTPGNRARSTRESAGWVWPPGARSLRPRGKNEDKRGGKEPGSTGQSRTHPGTRHTGIREIHRHAPPAGPEVSMRSLYCFQVDEQYR